MSIDTLFRLEDSAAARASDPDTSHEAAEAVSPHVWESQQATLAIMRAHGKPLTALQVEQIADARELPHSMSRMRSTLSELETKGYVERVGKTRPEHGRGRVLWGLVPCSCGNPDPSDTKYGRMCAHCARDFFNDAVIHD